MSPVWGIIPVAFAVAFRINGPHWIVSTVVEFSGGFGLGGTGSKIGGGSVVPVGKILGRLGNCM